MNVQISKKKTKRFVINMILTGIILLSPNAIKAGLVWKEALHASTPRSMHAMVTNYSKGNILLFSGGAFGEGWNQDMMEWEGSQWVRASESEVRPSARENARMIYNRNEGSIYLFGGFCLTSATDSQSLWKYVDESWTEIPMESGWPIGRECHAMAYDPESEINSWFKHGGTFSELEGEVTWEWNGGISDGSVMSSLADRSGETDRSRHVLP